MPQPPPGRFQPSELWQTAREPTFWLDSDLRFAWVNQAWEALTGHSAESVVGLACHSHGLRLAGTIRLTSRRLSIRRPNHSPENRPEPSF